MNIHFAHHCLQRFSRALTSVLILVLLTSVTAQAATPQVGPDDDTPGEPVLQLVTVTDEVVNPVFVTHAGDGSERLFIVERAGRIRILQDGALLPTPFLDISAKVEANTGECGLLSLAFAPDFSTSGEFYVYYNYDVAALGDLVEPELPDEPNGGCDSVVARFSATGNVADAASETAVLTVNQPYNNHNGGQIAFGPDGYLYIALGDGGSGGDPHRLAQNPASLLGKLLRIDVANQATYIVPDGNPFTNSVGFRPEIWALGLRNPWRFSFDRATGNLYVADVGQSEVEEINLQSAASSGGENYGWNIVEGDRCFLEDECDSNGLTPPLFTYAHEASNCGGSVTGGYVVRSDADSLLNGLYIFGDYCLRKIWALQQTAPAAGAVELFAVDFSVVSFGEDEGGALYVAGSDNTVYRIVAQDRPYFVPLVRR